MFTEVTNEHLWMVAYKGDRFLFCKIFFCNKITGILKNKQTKKQSEETESMRYAFSDMAGMLELSDKELN